MVVTRWIIETTDRFKSQEICNEAMRINPFHYRMFLTDSKLKKGVMLQREKIHAS